MTGLYHRCTGPEGATWECVFLIRIPVFDQESLGTTALIWGAIEGLQELGESDQNRIFTSVRTMEHEGRKIAVIDSTRDYEGPKMLLTMGMKFNDKM